MPSFKIIHLLVLEIFKGFCIYSHGGHLGHVTMTIFTNFHSPFLIMLHTKFGFDWPSGIREEGLPLGYIYSKNHKYSVHLPISIKCFTSNDLNNLFVVLFESSDHTGIKVLAFYLGVSFSTSCYQVEVRRKQT